MPKKVERRSWESMRRSRRWSEADGRWVVAELRRSGLSAKQFAEDHQVMATRIYHWCARLRREEPGAADSDSTATSRFVEVRLPSASRSGLDGGAERIEVELSGGRRLSVPERMSPERLSALVAALERRGC